MTGELLHKDTVATIRESLTFMPPSSIRARLRSCADRLETDAEREREALAAADEMADAAEEFMAICRQWGFRPPDKIQRTVAAWREFG